MAEAVFTNWIPVEYDANVIQRVKQVSAVEMFGQNVNMQTESRSTPRTGGADIDGIAKGGTYGEDAQTNDSVFLYAQKYGGAVRVAEEDLNDSLANIVDAKTIAAATSYAKIMDNSCLAVTAAPTSYVTNGGRTNWQFASLYYLLTQNDSNTGYVANANLNKTTPGSGVQYSDLSNALAVVESGDYWDTESTLVIASPKYRQALRNVVDKQGRPIFIESSNGNSGGGQTPGDTLFGFPVRWSLGMRTSAYPTSKPSGNPLLLFCSPDYLLKGNREPLSTQFIDGNVGLGALTDEAFLKYRARKAFVPGHEGAFSMLEWQP